MSEGDSCRIKIHMVGTLFRFPIYFVHTVAVILVKLAIRLTK